jgi:hypothetical protein
MRPGIEFPDREEPSLPLSMETSNQTVSVVLAAHPGNCLLHGFHPKAWRIVKAPVIEAIAVEMGMTDESPAVSRADPRFAAAVQKCDPVGHEFGVVEVPANVRWTVDYLDNGLEVLVEVSRRWLADGHMFVPKAEG